MGIFSLSCLLAAAFFSSVDSFLWTNINNHDPYRKQFAGLHSSTPSQQRHPTKPNQFQRNNAYNKRDQLRRVIQSIEFYGQNPGDKERAASKELLEAMAMLSRARTQKDVTLAGRQLEKLDIVERESRAIQERVLKASALAGLLHTSLAILGKMLDESYLPSYMAYTATCSALRRAGRCKQLEDLLYHLAAVASERGENLNVFAWNTYLALICSSAEHPQDQKLEQAWNWLQPQVAKDTFTVEPDLASYNTVLYASSRVGNRTLVDAIWNEMTQQSTFKPDIRSYNARLTVTSMMERLALLKEIEVNQDVSPDRYTIDLVIVPLIREGRVGDLEDLLDNFVARNSDEVVKDAFSAFLITLVSKGEISSARALFDTYIVPCLSKEMQTDESLSSIIRPDTRHFNVLIDGYRRLAESLSHSSGRGQPNSKDDSKSRDDPEGKPKYRSEKEMAQYEGRKLCRLMIDSGIEPDAYTLTSMMSLCMSTDQLFKLIKGAKIKITPVVVRAALTACGRLGDPSSACVLFDHYSPGSMNVRVWNVLLGALSDGAKLKNAVVDVESCPLGEIAESKGDRNGTSISDLVDGLSCTEAVLVVLNAMRGSQTVVTPYPNSQSYCIAASALQYGAAGAEIAMELFQNSTDEGIPADGRFVNAVFRCFGDDIDSALSSWKNKIRKECLTHESKPRRASVSIYRSKNKNLIAAYNGLFYVCGRALRPDIAVRLAYAMNREGIEPNDVSLNNYRSGKRIREKLDGQNSETGEEKENSTGAFARRSIPKLLNMIDQYENLLYVECTKYDQYDKRMSKDKRVRIIV